MLRIPRNRDGSISNIAPEVNIEIFPLVSVDSE